MNKVSKKQVFFILILCIFSFFVTPAYADSLVPSDWQEQYDELLDASGVKNLFSILPEDTKGLLSDSGIDGADSENIINISFFSIVESVFNMAKKSIKEPITIFCFSVALILLYALLNSLKGTFEQRGYDQVFSVVSVISISAIIIYPISNLITRAAELIKTASDFLLSFIPIYVGVITASGKPISATAYASSLMAVVQVVSRVSATVLVPMLAIYMAFCLIGSSITSTGINILSIAKGVKNVVVISLSFLMTVFTGTLALQGAVATATDTLSLKTAKFAVSAFLPVVGCAVSEALNSVQGCMSLIKTTAGGFSIIGITAIFLPCIISILLIQLALYGASLLSEAFETDRISSLLKCSNTVLSLLLGIIIVFFVMLVISIGIMLTITK